MKANNGSGNIPERDTWETPQALWDKLNEQYKFAFDCCANKDNSKCKIHFTNDFESIDFLGYITVWMNPPFSIAEDMFNHFFKIAKKGIAIYRCDNLETAIWQRAILPYADWVFIPKGRICYEGMKGKGSRFPSALIGIGLPPPKGLNGFTLYFS